jgi:hypothetical protein
MGNFVKIGLIRVYSRQFVAKKILLLLFSARQVISTSEIPILQRKSALISGEWFYLRLGCVVYQKDMP